MLRIPGLRNTKATRYAAAGVTTAGAAAIAITGLAGTADAGDHSQSTAKKVTAAPVAFPHSSADHPQADDAKAQQGTLDADIQRVDQKIAAQKQQSIQVAQAKADARKASDDQAQAKKAAERRAADAGDKKASRSSDRPQVKSYPNNLDGWIREARAIMQKHHIPGSYDGIKRNIIRESGGNPNIANNWDVNAQKGTPSKGLLQVIQPTFDKYHVEGTANKLTDPVANIVAACNYAADRYGSMDNVNSAY